MHITIFLFDGVTALDAVGPFESLQRIADSEIVFVAEKAGAVRTGDGMLSLHADRAFADIGRTDLLIMPGGHPRGLRAVMADRAVLDWIGRVDEHTRWTTSVCTGSLILAASGLLDGRRATSHWRAEAAIRRTAAIWSPDRIVVDGKYVTCGGVTAGVDMGLLLCGEIAGRDIGEAIELSMHYLPQPPFGTGDPVIHATPERIRLIETMLRP